MDWSLVLAGCGITALSTGLGSLPALFLHRLSERTRNILMGFSAGIMLSASAFSLILPALQMLIYQLSSKLLGSTLTGVMLLCGALLLFLCNKYVPHEHFVSGREGGASSLQLKRIWLFVMAITIHNFPEGLAVGGATGSQSLSLALPVMAGIGLQDFPEGFVVAAALISVGYSRKESLIVAVLTGLVEAAAAFLGYLATSFFTPLVPWFLAFAGGAMIYVVVEEMIPEVQSKKISSDASAGLLIGFVLMMILDVTLGS